MIITATAVAKVMMSTATETSWGCTGNTATVDPPGETFTEEVIVKWLVHGERFLWTFEVGALVKSLAVHIKIKLVATWIHWLNWVHGDFFFWFLC